MNNLNLILATYKSGQEITVQQVTTWIEDKEKLKLADFIYQRLHGRYIQPFSYDDAQYISEYKSGFSIMTNCCLLIETLSSFKKSEFRNTNGNSERCFGWFFKQHSAFIDFAEGGLSEDDYLNDSIGMRKNNTGIPKDFYANIRCGILHNAETRNGWKIRRTGRLFDVSEKAINATKFMSQIDKVLTNYKETLEESDIDSDLWKIYIGRLGDIITNA